MSDIPESFFHYLAAWNEADTNRIRAHLERSVAPDVLFVDPANTTRGIDELESMIRSARQEHRCVRRGHGRSPRPSRA